MILSDREAHLIIERGLIGLDPFPTEPWRWSTHAVDLTLDTEISAWNEPTPGGMEQIIAPGSPDFNANEIVRRYTTPHSCAGSGYIVSPRRFVLGWSIEKLRLPRHARIGARVEGKSSLARIGLGIHVTAPTIHPGFGVSDEHPSYPGSPIRLEIWNIGAYPIRLVRGMAICQLLFEEVHGVPSTERTGQFAVQGPTAPAPSPSVLDKRPRRKKK